MNTTPDTSEQKLARWLEKAPIPWIDHFFVLANLAFVLLITVLVSRYGPDRTLPFQGHTVQLVDPATVLPLFILYEVFTSFFIWRKKPLASGRAGWFLVIHVIFAALFYAISGGIGSIYFYPFVMVVIYAALSLKAVAAAHFILALLVFHIIIGAALIPTANWDEDVMLVAIGELAVLLVLGGIALIFTRQLRKDARAYQTALAEAKRSTLLNEISLRLVEHGLDLASVLQTILQAVQLLPQTEFVLVMLHDPTDQKLRVVASTADKHMVGNQVSHLGWLADLRHVIVTGAGYPLPLSADFAHDAVRQVILLPLNLPSGELLGAIGFGRQSDQPLTVDEQKFVEDLGAEAVLAVRNARLYAQELEQVERLHRFQDLQTSYFSALAHEMKTPLTVLRTLTPSLRQLPDLTDETRSEILEAIDGNLARLQWSINSIIEGARLEAGVVVLHPSPVNLAESVRQVVARISPWLDLKRQLVSVKAARDLPLVLADGSQIDHVLTNLLVNAIKFAPADSTIDVRLQPVEKVMQTCVEDEGPGVPPDQRESIFDKFHTLAAGNAAGGAGLGLYICREVVRRHGGRIWMEERPGGGSRFCFTLPLADGESVDEESANETGANEISADEVSADEESQLQDIGR